MNLRDWCPYCHKYVDTSQMSNRANDTLGNPVMIIEYYCTLCCRLIFTEEKPIIEE